MTQQDTRTVDRVLDTFASYQIDLWGWRCKQGTIQVEVPNRHLAKARNIALVLKAQGINVTVEE